MEVGWAQDINSRSKAHVTNYNTTPLFGRVNAISHQFIADGDATFPSSMQLILFLIWKVDMDFKNSLRFWVRSFLLFTGSMGV